MLCSFFLSLESVIEHTGGCSQKLLMCFGRERLLICAAILGVFSLLKSFERIHYLLPCRFFFFLPVRVYSAHLSPLCFSHAHTSGLLRTGAFPFLCFTKYFILFHQRYVPYAGGSTSEIKGGQNRCGKVLEGRQAPFHKAGVAQTLKPRKRWVFCFWKGGNWSSALEMQFH